MLGFFCLNSSLCPCYSSNLLAQDFGGVGSGGIRETYNVFVEEAEPPYGVWHFIELRKEREVFLFIR